MTASARDAGAGEPDPYTRSAFTISAAATAVSTSGGSPYFTGKSPGVRGSIGYQINIAPAHAITVELTVSYFNAFFQGEKESGSTGVLGFSPGVRYTFSFGPLAPWVEGLLGGAVVSVGDAYAGAGYCTPYCGGSNKETQTKVVISLALGFDIVLHRGVALVVHAVQFTQIADLGGGIAPDRSIDFGVGLRSIF
jgi:hypothetical protein